MLCRAEMIMLLPAASVEINVLRLDVVSRNLLGKHTHARVIARTACQTHLIAFCTQNKSAMIFCIAAVLRHHRILQHRIIDIICINDVK